jgi:hypothetical protein
MLKFFQKQKEIVTVMSEKKDGQMKLRARGYIKNRQKFLGQLGIDLSDVVSADLCHGKSVKIIRDKKQKISSKTDGLVSNQAGIFLAVTVADCLPIVFFEPKKKIIGMVHSGWKSTVKNIAEVAVKKIEQLGGNPKDLMVEVGPGIGECHFEVGRETLPKFKKYQKFVKIKQGKYFVDLKGVVGYQLEKSGIKKSNIKISKTCTFCDKKYFSSRRDNNKITKVAVVIIGMKK